MNMPPAEELEDGSVIRRFDLLEWRLLRGPVEMAAMHDWALLLHRVVGKCAHMPSAAFLSAPTSGRLCYR